MATEMESPAGTPADRSSPLTLELESVPSTLQTAGGKAIRFTRALLVIRNMGLKPLQGLFLRVTLSQEGGRPQEIAQDLTPALAGGEFPPGERVTRDLFDLLAAGHPGVASKVHLFGYKAVLNWWFDLTVGADYRVEGESVRQETPPFRARFRWNALPGALDQVDLSIERRDPGPDQT